MMLGLIDNLKPLAGAVAGGVLAALLLVPVAYAWGRSAEAERCALREIEVKARYAEEIKDAVDRARSGRDAAGRVYDDTDAGPDPYRRD